MANERKATSRGASTGSGSTNGRGEGIWPRLTSGYVFKSVFGDDKELCRELIEVALGIEVARIEFVQPERELDVLREARAGRLDVYVVDSEGNRYDVEVQARQRGDEWMRARHYQSLMDATQLRAGTRAADLRDSVVIFVCDFDPLGAGLRSYDCRTTCLETGQPIPDRRRLVLLNARGREGEVSPGLDAFLRAVAGEEVEGDPFVDRINAIIRRCIAEPEWLEGYMTFEDELEAERRYGEEIGERRGREEGERRGREEGERRGKAELAAKLVRDGVMDVARAAAFAGVSAQELEAELESRDAD